MDSLFSLAPLQVPALGAVLENVWSDLFPLPGLIDGKNAAAT